MPFGQRKQTNENPEPGRRFEFVGRKRELGIFFDDVYLPADAPNKKPIISIAGVGGIGKTRFLQHIIQNLPSEFIVSFVDETDEIDDDIGRLLIKICRNTRKSGKSVNFGKTNNLIARRNELIGHLQAIKDEIPKGFFELIYSGARLAVGSTPIGPVMDLVAPESKVAEVMASLSNRLLQKRHGKDDLALLIEPKSVLTKAFIDDINQLAEGNKSILLMFDTYETIGLQINPWLLKFMIGENRQRINCNLHIVLAGRTSLEGADQRWHQWRLDDLVLDLNLQVFSDDELREYVQVNHRPEKIDIEDLAEITSRLPLWLELWSMSGKTLAEYRSIVDTNNITDRLLRALPSDQHRDWVKKASLLPSFNKDVLATLLGDNTEVAYNWLSAQSFVKSSTDNQIKLHDEMTDIIKKHVFNSSPETWEESYKTVANFYSRRAEKISKNTDDNPYRILNLDFQEVIAKFYYHALQQTDVHFIIRSQLFGCLLEALHYDLSFFHRLSDQIDSFNKRSKVKLPDVRTPWLSKDFETFREILKTLIEKYSLTSRQIAVAHNWIGYAFSLQDRWKDAIVCYDKAENSDSFLISIYYDRSEAYLHVGQGRKSKNDLVKGKKLLQVEMFVGRESTLDEFRRSLEASLKPDTPGILYIGDKGGMGKTTLLRDVTELARRNPGRLPAIPNTLDTFYVSSQSLLKDVANTQDLIDEEITKTLSHIKEESPEYIKVVRKKSNTKKTIEASKFDKSFGKKNKRKK